MNCRGDMGEGTFQQWQSQRDLQCTTWSRAKSKGMAAPPPEERQGRETLTSLGPTGGQLPWLLSKE